MINIILFIVVKIFVLSCAHYTDDSDYNDFDIYNESSVLKKSSIINFHNTQNHDDFYIISADDDNAMNAVEKSEDFHPATEKLYRYTKHRIPGYDYDEVDLVDEKDMQRCDERSLRTHCLCQFTCSQPNIVDCYTPCISGCECKEDFVFDEISQQCVYPEDCQIIKNDEYSDHNHYIDNDDN